MVVYLKIRRETGKRCKESKKKFEWGRYGKLIPATRVKMDKPKNIAANARIYNELIISSVQCYAGSLNPQACTYGH